MKDDVKKLTIKENVIVPNGLLTITLLGMCLKRFKMSHGNCWILLHIYSPNEFSIISEMRLKHYIKLNTF